ncbi:S8 family serine peptidase [Vibrio owensii]|uniref:S8 family serine peptidase n=1 Tax=Vibrio owensii TaxID=696485 RepID=UPI0018F19B77|nr:hypothetical protein [Vibrio owensii]
MTNRNKKLFNPLKLLAVGSTLGAFIYITNIDYDFERKKQESVEPVTKQSEPLTIEQRQAISYSEYKESAKPQKQETAKDQRPESKDPTTNTIEAPSTAELASWANGLIREHEKTNNYIGFLKAFDKNKVYKTDDGETYAANYLIVTLERSSYSQTKAERIAKQYNGKVVGAYPNFNWVQIEFETSSLSEMEDIASLILQDKRVKAVAFDTLPL